MGFALRQHKGMVEAADTVLGKILAAVDLSTTYVIVLGDNGSPGHTVEPPFSLKKNKNSLYESGLNVPFVVAGPGVAQGQTCDELISITDIFATVRDLAGLGAPTRGAEDSVSFASLLREPNGPATREALYIHRFPHKGAPGPNQRAVRTKRWKLIENLKNRQAEFYDLDADPFEGNNLAARALDEAGEDKTLSEAMASLRKHFPPVEAAPKKR